MDSAGGSSVLTLPEGAPRKERRKSSLARASLFGICLLPLLTAACTAQALDPDTSYETCRLRLRQWELSNLRSKGFLPVAFWGEPKHLCPLLFHVAIPFTEDYALSHCFLKPLFSAEDWCPSTTTLGEAIEGEGSCRFVRSGQDVSSLWKIPFKASVATAVTSLAAPAARIVRAHRKLGEEVKAARTDAMRRERLNATWPSRTLVSIFEAKVPGSPPPDPAAVPLEDFIEHPAANAALHNGMTFHLAGLTEVSEHPNATYYRDCMRLHPNLTSYALDMAKEALMRMFHVDIAARSLDSARIFYIALGRALEFNAPFDPAPRHTGAFFNVPAGVRKPFTASPGTREDSLAHYEKCAARLQKSEDTDRFIERLVADMPARTAARIAELNSLDVQLYAYTLELFGNVSATIQYTLGPLQKDLLGTAGLDYPRDIVPADFAALGPGEGGAPAAGPGAAQHSGFTQAGPVYHDVTNICLLQYPPPLAAGSGGEGGSAVPWPLPNIVAFSDDPAAPPVRNVRVENEFGPFEMPLTVVQARPPPPSEGDAARGWGPVKWFSRTFALIHPFTFAQNLWHLTMHYIILTQNVAELCSGADTCSLHLHPTVATPQHSIKASNVEVFGPFLYHALVPPNGRATPVNFLATQAAAGSGAGGAVEGGVWRPSQPAICYARTRISGPLLLLHNLTEGKVPGHLFGEVSRESFLTFRHRVLEHARAVGLRSSYCPNQGAGGRGGGNGDWAGRPLLAFVNRVARRRLLNALELIAAARAAGFEVRHTRLERLTFAEQIRLYRMADVVVAPHGSGLTHVIYMRKHTAVIEVYPPDPHLAPSPNLTVGWNLNKESNYGSIAYAVGVEHCALAEIHEGMPQEWKFRDKDPVVSVAALSAALAEAKERIKLQEPCS